MTTQFLNFQRELKFIGSFGAVVYAFAICSFLAFPGVGWSQNSNQNIKKPAALPASAAGKPVVQKKEDVKSGESSGLVAKSQGPASPKKPGAQNKIKSAVRVNPAPKEPQPLVYINPAEVSGDDAELSQHLGFGGRSNDPQAFNNQRLLAWISTNLSTTGIDPSEIFSPIDAGFDYTLKVPPQNLSTLPTVTDSKITSRTATNLDLAASANPVPEKVEAELAQELGDSMNGLTFGPLCSRYASPLGLGKFGIFVVQEFLSGRHEQVTGGNGQDLRQICPRYEVMTALERAHVWVMVMAAMADSESGCNERAVAQGPYGTLMGMFQLFDGNEASSTGAPDCRNGDARNPIKSIRCTMSRVNVELKDFANLFNRGSHFGVLRSQGDLVTDNKGRKARVHIWKIIANKISSLRICRSSPGY